MVTKEIYSFKSSDDAGTTIHAVKWTPAEGEPRAVLQITHGMVEYIERYEEFAGFLADNGFAVMGHDHIGHGDSVSSSADWGIMHSKNPADTMVEDMFTQYKLIEEQYPSIPHFILGHSMGSYLLRRFLIQKSSEISRCSGAIIMGTGTETAATIGFAKFLVKTMMAFRGPDYRSKFVTGIAFGSGAYKRYDVTGADTTKSWLTKDEQIVRKYYSDPKCTYLFSLNGYTVLFESIGFDIRLENVSKMQKDMPVLVVSGADDPVGNLGAGVKSAYELIKSAGIKDVELKLYEGDRHEILNETDRQTVYADLLKWMTDRM